MALEVCLIARLFFGSLWRRYPYFAAYVLFFVTQSIVLFTLLRWAPGSYALWYWWTGRVNLALRFFIVAEVFRQTFPAGSSLRRMVSGGFRFVTLLTATLAGGMLWGIHAFGRAHLWDLALERSFGFAQAVLILLILIVARYYHVQLGRNVWGIAVAFGMYSSLIIANSAFLDLLHSFLPYWTVIGPMSLVVMLALWAWAIWIYAPNPVPVTQPVADAAALRAWSDGWGQTLSSVRKVTNP